MGTIFAPNYDKIFKGKFKKAYIYPYINLFSNFYCRFIDDIFYIWNGTVTQLQELIKELNDCHFTIKFYHPRSLIKSIPYSQALHLKKFCTKVLEPFKNLPVLKESFRNVAFNEKILDTELQRLSEIEGNALLAPKSKEKDQNRILFLERNIAYQVNKNLVDLIESKKILNGKVVFKNTNKKQHYCRPCFTRGDGICCQQILKKNTFNFHKLEDWRNV